MWLPSRKMWSKTMEQSETGFSVMSINAVKFVYILWNFMLGFNGYGHFICYEAFSMIEKGRVDCKLHKGDSWYVMGVRKIPVIFGLMMISFSFQCSYEEDSIAHGISKAQKYDNLQKSYRNINLEENIHFCLSVFYVTNFLVAILRNFSRR